MLERAWKREQVVSPVLLAELAEERSRELMESYKEEAVRMLPALENASLKGLLRRVVARYFRWRSRVGAVSLRLEMLQVARLSPKQLGDSSKLVERFLHSQRNDDGGFQDGRATAISTTRFLAWRR